MGLFGSPKIEGTELQQCLVYFEAETKVITFQTKEADLYNDVMVKYGNSTMDDTQAASVVSKAARRMSLSADEILKRYENIKNVPSPASQSHYAWYATFMAYKAWSSAAAAAADAMANGRIPNFSYVQQLANEMQKWGKRAHEEDKKFLKRLKVSADEIANIVERATSLNSIDSWEPKIG